LLSENAIDFIKWDMNRHIAEPGWPDAPTAQQREVWVRHARAVYELLDELRAKHPSVLWESCSGGGGRADLGILQRTDQVWTSDNTDPLDRLAIQEGYTHAFAPKTMVAWVTDNPDGINHRATPLAFRFHCAMLGTLGVGGDLLKWSEAELKEAKFHLDEYKAIRPLVQEGQLYRLRSPRDSATSAFEFVAADRTQAVLFVFLSASRMGDEQPTLRLAGLEPNARYRLESRQPPGESPLLSPRVLSGAALRERGLTLRWRGDYVSALIRLEVVR
jgi:alpha-galactosidase